MPTYEYACMSCGTHVEVYQRFSEDALTVCGVCGGPLRKVFHPAGILFKGSGFYATDSRAASKGAGANGEKGDSTSGEKVGTKSGSGSKSESSDGSKAGSSDGSDSKSGSSDGSKKERSPQKDASAERAKEKSA